METLLKLVRWVDLVNDGFATIAKYTVFAACAISAGNAVVRYAFNTSSNAWLEIQWYLFAACVMLGAAQVLRVNEHVRVDVLYGRYSSHGKVWVDLFGLVCFLVPVMVAMLYYSWPLFVRMLSDWPLKPRLAVVVLWS